jgi:branched-chain amino acid transport system permease protein
MAPILGIGATSRHNATLTMRSTPLLAIRRHRFSSKGTCSVSELVSVVVFAMEIGSVYALLNFGFVYLIRATGVVSFAQGQIATLGALVAVNMTHAWGLTMGLVATFFIVAAGAAVVYYLVLQVFHGRSEFVRVIGTFMLGLIILEVCGLVWGSSPYTLPVQPQAALDFGDAHIPIIAIADVGGVAAIVLTAAFLLKKTGTGIQFRAFGDDETLAQYRGVRFRRLNAIAWVIASCSALAAAIVYAQRSPVSTDMWTIGLAAFPGAVIGGLDSVAGTLIGSMVVALVAGVISFYYSGTIAIIVTYGLMLVALLFLPNGLLGSRRAERL